MRKLYVLSFFLFSVLLCSAQTRVIFEGNIGLAFNGGTQAEPVYLVIDNPNDDAIVDAGAVGGPAIRSESEYNIVKWNVRNSTGTYNVPFVSLTGGLPEYVAPSVTIGVAGSETSLGSGTILFSTYNHDNNVASAPSDVTHMNQHPSGLPGGEDEAIDRFWIMDAQGFSTRPSAAIGIVYDEDEFDGAMTEPDLLLQRFNPSLGAWLDYNLSTPGDLAVDPVNNVIATTAPVAGGDFFRSWTIANLGNPLPIELSRLEANCAGPDKVVVEWTTSSELNNDFFTLERSEDGFVWEAFHFEPGAGNSSQSLHYAVTDENPFRGLTYYRLTQTDFDGHYEIFDPVVSDCDGVGFEIINAHNILGGDEMQLTVSAGHNEVFDIELMDLSGKRLAYLPSEALLEGLNFVRMDTRNIPYGIYVVRLVSETRQMTRKVQLN